jgi:hypothetical protein
LKKGSLNLRGDNFLIPTRIFVYRNTLHFAIDW